MKRGSEDWASLTPFLWGMPACELILFLMGPSELSFSQNLSGQTGTDLPAKGEKKKGNSPIIANHPQTLCNLTPPWFSNHSVPRINLRPALVRSSTFMFRLLLLPTCVCPTCEQYKPILTLEGAELQEKSKVCCVWTNPSKTSVFSSCKILVDKWKLHDFGILSWENENTESLGPY